MSAPLLRRCRRESRPQHAFRWHLATCVGAARRAPRPGCESAGVTVVAPDPGELLHRMVRGRDGLDARGDHVSVTHVERLPARAGVRAPWPDWVPTELRERLA